VKLLVDEYGCDFMEKDKEHGVTPLHLAASGGHKDILRFYASKGANAVSVKDIHGRTPLHYACQDGHLGVVRVLVKELQCDANEKDKKGVTPLQLAVINGNTEIAKWIREGTQTTAVSIFMVFTM